MSNIEVIGARENNLKNIDVSIPKNKLVVITGLSGSGKSSLAFQTIYAEGQRRYLDSFSNYARQFVGGIERPDVDSITGLSPVISIEQKSTNKNPRSTVGTITEIYDFLRLLFAKVAVPVSYISGEPMRKFSEEEILQTIHHKQHQKKVAILAPLVKGRKGHYRELFESLIKKGYNEVVVDGEYIKLHHKMQLDRYKIHNIELLIDKLSVTKDNSERIVQSVRTALKESDGIVILQDIESKQLFYYSKMLMDAENGISYPEPSANSFSFNSPFGACPACKGMGEEYTVSFAHCIPDDGISLLKGGLHPLGESRENQWWNFVRKFAKTHEIDLTGPIRNIPKDKLNLLLYGNTAGELQITEGEESKIHNFIDGLFGMVYKCYYESDSEGIRKWAESFMTPIPCGECHGDRLQKESLYFKILDKNIAMLNKMSINELIEWFGDIEPKLSDNQNKIAKDLLKEIRSRLSFLDNVGLGYLSLERQSRSLSGGEAQRIRLATQIGSELVGVTYILDEPSIGLHQRDNQKLIASLKSLRDIGNSIIVVEHDEEIMMESDHIIDIGPLAGEQGGYIVAEGSPKQFLSQKSTTASFLKGNLSFDIPKERRKPSQWISIKKASGNNLKNVDVDIPLGVFCCIAGVSGSGKSTLINETLYPILSQKFYKSYTFPLPYGTIEGIDQLDKVIDIDQSPIGRTPRSNPATYMKILDDIRILYSNTSESKIRGYNPGRFSFNVKGGRCEECEGAGLKTIEMNFLPDIQVLCEKCNGKRYNKQTLEIRYKHLSIYDVLNLSVSEAIPIFEAMPKIYSKLKTLEDVGLGYIKLGQSSTTLSGGEAQRVKLASELCKRDTGKTMYILDEPTTGLHFQDIQMLFGVLQQLVDKGNSIVIIEHNLDVIKMCDYIIDMGPEGGKAGGMIVAKGSPEEISKDNNSVTGKFLKGLLN